MTGPLVNLVPAQYREVSVAEVPVPLEEGALRAYLTGRDVYRRTRYVIARNGAASMLAEVTKQSEQPLFSPVTSVTVLARADETVLVDVPDVDTAVPTQLARAAAGFFGRRTTVSGHTRLLGYNLDWGGSVRLRPGAEPAWPDPDPRDKAPKKQAGRAFGRRLRARLFGEAGEASAARPAGEAG